MVSLIQHLCHVFIILCLAVYIAAQESESVRIPPNDGETCNVINVNCGTGPVAPSEVREMGQQGFPGKRGHPGLVGPQGVKGDKGNQGEKGDEGHSFDLSALRMELVNMIGFGHERVNSCRQLSIEYGLGEPRYYIPGLSSSTSFYCDLVLREGVSTCQGIKNKYGVSESGVYRIQPDALGEEFDVVCNFTVGEAYTEVWHDLTNEIKARKCENPGCYSKSPQYILDQDQILKIINNSTKCRQYIKLRCDGVMLFGGGSGWWVSRDGEKMTYWGGTTRENHCACGVDGSCVDNRYKCNCDNNVDGVITADEGFLTDKLKLPVRELRFGDMGGANEHGWHTLGTLQCSG